MSLSVDGIALPGRVGARDAAAQFRELAAKYQFDERIATHLVETVGLETLVDFAHAVTSENEWAPILERVPDLERRLGQLSRVRQPGPQRASASSCDVHCDVRGLLQPPAAGAGHRGAAAGRENGMLVSRAFQSVWRWLNANKGRRLYHNSQGIATQLRHSVDKPREAAAVSCARCGGAPPALASGRVRAEWQRPAAGSPERDRLLLLCGGAGSESEGDSAPAQDACSYAVCESCARLPHSERPARGKRRRLPALPPQCRSLSLVERIVHGPLTSELPDASGARARPGVSDAGLRLPLRCLARVDRSDAVIDAWQRQRRDSAVVDDIGTKDIEPRASLKAAMAAEIQDMWPRAEFRGAMRLRSAKPEGRSTAVKTGDDVAGKGEDNDSIGKGSERSYCPWRACDDTEPPPTELEQRILDDRDAHRDTVDEVRRSMQEELKLASERLGAVEAELTTARQRCEHLMRNKADLQQELGDHAERHKGLEARNRLAYPRLGLHFQGLSSLHLNVLYNDVFTTGQVPQGPCLAARPAVLDAVTSNVTKALAAELRRLPVDALFPQLTDVVEVLEKWHRRFPLRIWKRFVRVYKGAAHQTPCVLKEFNECAPVIDRVRAWIATLPEDAPPATVIDLGAGFGFLSMLLAELLPPQRVARCILIDADFPNRGLEVPSGQISTEHIYGCGQWRIPLCTLKVDLKKGRALNQVGAHLLRTPAEQDVAAGGAGEAPAAPPVFLCGVHLCNTLSLRAAQLFNEHPEATALALAPCCFPTQRHLAQQVVYQLGAHRFAASQFLDSRTTPSSAARFASWNEHILEGIEPGPGGTKAMERHQLHRPQSGGMFAQDRYIFAARPWRRDAVAASEVGQRTGGRVVVDAEYGHAAARRGRGGGRTTGGAVAPAPLGCDELAAALRLLPVQRRCAGPPRGVASGGRAPRAVAGTRGRPAWSNPSPE
ncbi:unnamed protein product [Prorocentrum cordatum]|uniref:Methyltransferase domain-containing protein n=1 Tax=Prorocentrum cordatum TaxID=2364126 RepID=A0ABN9SQS3_9DINO|nr:unnamed protein product [Polarella glacialis]